MVRLLSLAQEKGIKILNNVIVKSFSEDTGQVKIETNQGVFTSS
jgi:hypothetical protein